MAKKIYDLASDLQIIRMQNLSKSKILDGIFKRLNKVAQLGENEIVVKIPKSIFKNTVEVLKYKGILVKSVKNQGILSGHAACISKDNKYIVTF